MAISEAKFREMIKVLDADGDGQVDKVRRCPAGATAQHALRQLQRQSAL